MSELDKEFEKEVELAYSQIKEKLDLVHKYLNEAAEVSEKTGIPFGERLFGFKIAYTPKISKKYSSDQWDNIYDITNYYGGDGEEGWSSSSLC